jgi:cytoskeleton-associated protein 5
MCITPSFSQDGLESKNSKTRVVCLEELAAMIDRHGPQLYRTPAGSAAAAPASRPASAAAGGGGQDAALAMAARLVAERDAGVRSGVLALLEALYCFEGAGGFAGGCWGVDG